MWQQCHCHILCYQFQFILKLCYVAADVATGYRDLLAAAVSYFATGNLSELGGRADRAEWEKDRVRCEGPAQLQSQRLAWKDYRSSSSHLIRPSPLARLCHLRNLHRRPVCSFVLPPSVNGGARTGSRPSACHLLGDAGAVRKLQYLYGECMSGIISCAQ